VDACALGVCALAFGAAFGWALLSGRFLIGGDVFFYTYPMRTVAWRMIRAGVPPTWTPYVLSGYPLLAMAQLGLGYPLTWGHLFLPDHWAEELYVLAPFLLMPVFTYAYLRELGRSRLAALLAGLAFAYGGLTTNALGMNGIPTNAMTWLPLLLVALERARTRRLSACVAGAGGFYALSVLTGHAQSFLLVALVGVAYALFLALVPAQTEETDASAKDGTSEHENLRGRESSRVFNRHRLARWRPAFVAACGLALGACVAGFQLFETWRAARRSIRHEITYEFFSQGSFTPREALLSALAPLYHYIDVTTYVVPLALALALYAAARALRRKEPDPRALFWLAAAGCAFVFMLGEHTPVYRFAYRVPVLNLFRVPSRLAFVWTFALAALAAYGWDALSAHARDATTARGRLSYAALLVALSATVGVLWWLAVARAAPFGLTVGTTRAYVCWKLISFVPLCAGLWLLRRAAAGRVRAALLLCALFVGCMTEPLILIAQWWPGTAKPGARFTTPGAATRYLQQFPPAEGRVFVQANLGLDENAAAPRFDVLAQTAPYGLHNAAGYEQLLLTRYSRALGDVDYDAVRPRAGVAPPRIFTGPEARVLDLLNVTHVVAFREAFQQPAAQLEQHEGVGLDQAELGIELPPGATATLAAAAAPAGTLALVTSLANSVGVAQGETVGRVRVFMEDGGRVERELRAGVETAEWAHERADVRANIKHQLAPVFDSRTVAETGGYAAHRYWARLAFGWRGRVSRVEISNVAQTAALVVWKASLYDAGSAQSAPLTRDPARATPDPTRWQSAADFDGILVLRNTRAQPRAWLVTAAEAVDGEEALRRIRGEGADAFDPARTALLEVRPDELPALLGQPSASQTAVPQTARVVSYEATRLSIETEAQTPTVLVVSELFYPGWEARVDGAARPILLTDYLLRGVALPAGRHKVEMRYAATAARKGAVVSVLAVVSLLGLAVYGRRSERVGGEQEE
jgi:hypothetical protein